MTKANILIVEDELILAKDIQGILNSLGYKVPAIVSSGEEAIRKVSETCPDLVLMDIKLKGDMDGIEAAKLMKDRFNIPVVYLTAHADNVTLQRAKITDPFGYILKPFEEKDLRIGIEMALYKHQAGEQIRKLSRAVECNPCTIVVTDTIGNIEYVNPKFTQLTGYSIEEAVGKNPRILKSGKTPPKEYKRLWETITSGNEWRGEFCNKKKNGELYWESASISPIKNTEGVITHYVAVKEDISERKWIAEQNEKLMSKLSYKNKELEQFVYVVSHDLRSPLVNIQGYSKELEQALEEVRSVLNSSNSITDVKKKLAPTLEEIPESLKYILTSTSKIDSLLSSLLRISRLGRAELTIKLLDMNKLISNVVSAFGYKIKDLGVTLHIERLPSCKGDEAQINQVFSNLLENALKFLDSNRSGIINISGLRENGGVSYCVDDNGIGITAEHQVGIFEIFSRLNPDNSGGEGLGLTIVRRILDRHEGKIRVESGPDKGCRFFVSLPG